MNCGICNGELEYMGTLGELDHYRCRNCGMDSSKQIEEDVDKPRCSVKESKRGVDEL